MKDLCIGIDFDHTIVCYGDVFYQIALEKQIIPQEIAPTKDAVRNYLRAKGKENIWTEIQGYVYGTQMDETTSFPGVAEFFLQSRWISLCIISHKTRRPFLGPAYDLHRSARNWIERQSFYTKSLSIFFEETLLAKLSRIQAMHCTHFIDDLPELLMHNSFPFGVEKILFDPENIHPSTPFYRKFSSWQQIKEYFLPHVKKN